MAGESGHPGRRERKKRETRTRMIDAAIALVDKLGYERTTVEQIAEAVDVSPRTVAHYFPSKDRLVLSVIDYYTDAVTAELNRVPVEIAPLHALLIANLAVLDHAVTHSPPAETSQIVTMLRTLHLSPSLRPRMTELRIPAINADVARRLGVDEDDRRVELVVAVWTGITATAWFGVNSVWEDLRDVPLADLTALMRNRLLDTFTEFAALSGAVS